MSIDKEYNENKPVLSTKTARMIMQLTHQPDKAMHAVCKTIESLSPSTINTGLESLRRELTGPKFTHFSTNQLRDKQINELIETLKHAYLS